MKNNKGFSLVELIVVIAIMAILAAVAIPTFATFITKANQAADDQFLADAEYAVQLANTADPSAVISPVTVTYVEAAEGVAAHLEITYGTGEDAITVKESDLTDDEATTVQKEIASILDWSFTFKYYNNTATITNGVITGNH